MPLGAAGSLKAAAKAMVAAEIGRPERADWATFCRWAEAEGWRVPARELELYAGALAGGAFVLRQGPQALGFVTAVAHQRSGWIGNLLIDPQRRGRGYGVLLLEQALAHLAAQGCESLWLTASEQGRPLYQRRGFRAVDRVVRWSRAGGTSGGFPPPPADAAALLAADARTWEESRRDLLTGVANGGGLFCQGQSLLLLQAGADLQILGPWYSREFCPRENRLLLTAALDVAGPAELVVDLVASAPLAPLLAAAGFERRGECALMVRGPLPAGSLAGLVALASLGSMG